MLSYQWRLTQALHVPDEHGETVARDDLAATLFGDDTPYSSLFTSFSFVIFLIFIFSRIINIVGEDPDSDSDSEYSVAGIPRSSRDPGQFLLFLW